MDLKNSRNKVVLGILVFALVAIVGVRLPMLATATNSTLIVQPVQVEDITVTNTEWTSEGLAFDLNITAHNPNFFPARIDRITYEVFLEQENLGSGNIEGTTIPGNSRKNLNDRFTVNGSEVVDAGIQAFSNYFTGQKIVLRVEGEMHVGREPLTAKIPFERRKRIN